MSGLAPTGVDLRAPRHTLWLAAAGGALALLVAAWVKSRCGMPAGLEGQYLQWCYSDIPPLFHAERLDVGAVPYLDHPVEYPPLTGLVMWVAALLPGSTIVAFWWWNVAVLAACSAGTAALLARAVGLRRALVYVAAPTLLVSGAVNWDLPSVLLATGGLVAHRRGRDGLAGVLLGLGAAAKLWPVLLLPAVVLAAGVLRGRGAGVRAALGAVLAWGAVNLPVALVAPEGWSRFIVLSRERPADWDSLWRIVPGWFGAGGPGESLNAWVGVVTLVGCAALLALAVRWDPPERWHLVGLPVVAWFLLAGKVYSPQFTLWLLPLLALAAPRITELVALGVADVAVTVTRFPYLGTAVGLEDGWGATPFEIAVAVRAVVLAVVAITAWRRAVARVPQHRTVLRVGPPPVTA